MAKLTKAKARKRLAESIRKVRRVMLWQTMGDATNPINSKDWTDLNTVCRTLERIVKKLR